MRFLLHPDISLRSWWRVPYAYYIRGVRDAKRLAKEEYVFLARCDGKTELEHDDLTDLLLRHGQRSPHERVLPG